MSSLRNEEGQIIWEIAIDMGGVTFIGDIYLIKGIGKVTNLGKDLLWVNFYVCPEFTGTFLFFL